MKILVLTFTGLTLIFALVGFIAEVLKRRQTPQKDREPIKFKNKKDKK